MEKIIHILENFLGESKRGVSTQGQLQFNCPCCANEKNVDKDDKFNLEVNIHLGKYHCWVCSVTNSTKGKISQLINKYGSQSLLQDYYNEINLLKTSDLYKLGISEDGENIINTEKIISLPPTYKPIDLINCKNKKVVEYITKRGITQDIINHYHIGYTNNYEENFLLKNRIIIPSYDFLGGLNYWVGRDYTNNPKAIKYWNSNINKKTIIFNESNIQWDADIILCEGPFDMISSLPNTIPLLGKTLSKDSLLFQTLFEKANGNIILYLDGDASRNMKIIYKNLNKDKLKDKIRYIPMNDNDDPSIILEKYGKKGVINTIKKMTTLSDVELLKYIN